MKKLWHEPPGKNGGSQWMGLKATKQRAVLNKGEKRVGRKG